MTITAAHNLPGAASGRPGSAATRNPMAGGHAFGDLLGDRRPLASASADEKPQVAGGRRHSREAGKTGGDALDKALDGRPAADPESRQDDPPLRDKLPLLVSLQHLSGQSQDHRSDAAIKDDKAEVANPAGEKATIAIPTTGHAAVEKLERSMSKGQKAEGASPPGPERTPGPSPEQPVKAGQDPVIDAQDAFPAPIDTAAVAADMRGKPVAAMTTAMRLPGLDGRAASLAAEPATAGDAAQSDNAVDAKSAARDAILSAAKREDRDPGQASAGKRNRDDAHPAITVTASQSFAAPASYSLNPTTAGLVAAIASDGSFRPTPLTSTLPGTPHVAVPAHILKIELNPSDLGSVTASLRLAKGQLSVELKPETHDAYRRLAADTDDITKSLKRLGLDVDSVIVMQPKIAATPSARADAAPSTTAVPNRDQASFQSGNPNGNGDGSAGRQSGQSSERNRDDGRHDGPRGAPASRNGAGGNLFI